MSTQIKGTRQDTWLVNLKVENPHRLGNMIDYGIWDTKSGGEIDSEENLYYPGGMRPAYSLGGRTNPGQITLSRNYRLSRDHDNIQQLIDAVGKSKVIISQRPMDRFKNPYGSPIVWRGTLKTLTLPEHNSMSTTDAAMIEIVCSIEAPPTST